MVLFILRISPLYVTENTLLWRLPMRAIEYPVDGYRSAAAFSGDLKFRSPRLDRWEERDATPEGATKPRKLT
jgi:hypothetical protein